MHYGTDEQLMPWDFGPKKRSASPSVPLAIFQMLKSKAALDLGCAVGRSTFELSKSSDKSPASISQPTLLTAAEQMRNQGVIDYPMLETGKQTTQATAYLPEGCRPENCRFLRGDAMNLPDDLGSFERVHAANLICRLTDPERLLDQTT